MAARKRTNIEQWRCGECPKTLDFELSYDGDMPEGWFRIEDRASHYVVCSVECLKNFVRTYEEFHAAGVVGQR